MTTNIAATRYEPRDMRSPQLVGLEGWRVEVVSMEDETRRFIVGTSMGPRKVSLELKTRRSLGGVQADRQYKSVRAIERVF